MIMFKKGLANQAAKIDIEHRMAHRKSSQTKWRTIEKTNDSELNVIDNVPIIPDSEVAYHFLEAGIDDAIKASIYLDYNTIFNDGVARLLAIGWTKDNKSTNDPQDIILFESDSNEINELTGEPFGAEAAIISTEEEIKRFLI